MLGNIRRLATAKTLSLSLVLAMLLNVSGGTALASPNPISASRNSVGTVAAKPTATKLAGKISEASPPEVIQQLRELLDQYQPQVSIASPRPDEVLQDNTVSVKFNVTDLPIFKDAKIGLGPHLHLFLDDQPYQAVYNVNEPFVLKDLAAGTHTLRVFPGRPWHESFKNDGAYAQVTFHVFTQTPNNNPDPKLPLLTYSRPQATYGAEPVLLDLYLTNAPLHFVAREDAKDDVPDWKIRVTVNGDRFMLDRWEPIYLKGFKPGKNWVQLEFIDEKGNPIPNVYNNTARVFTYEPNGQDALSRLTRGEISLTEARSIVDPNYKPEAVSAPRNSEGTEPPAPQIVPPVSEEKQPEAPTIKEKVPEPVPPSVEAEKPKGGFFNRFKQPTVKTTPAPVVPIPVPEKAIQEPEIEPTPLTEEPEVLPPAPEETETKAAPEVQQKPKGFFDRFKPRSGTPAPSIIPSPSVTPSEQPITVPKETEAPRVTVPEAEEAPRSTILDRLERSEPSASPSVPPSSEPSTIETPTVEEPEATEETTPTVKKAPKGGFFSQFKRPGVKPAPIVAPSNAPQFPKGVIAPSSEPVPDVLSAPDEADVKIIEPKPSEPEAESKDVPEIKEPEALQPESKDVPEVKEPAPSVSPKPAPSFLDRFRRPAVRPTPEVTAPPISARSSEGTVELAPIVPPEEVLSSPTPEPESSPVSEPETPTFQPRNELERRLGMPLNPATEPTKPAPSSEPTENALPAYNF